jgi:hypothetical protein
MTAASMLHGPSFGTLLRSVQSCRNLAPSVPLPGGDAREHVVSALAVAAGERVSLLSGIFRGQHATRFARSLHRPSQPVRCSRRRNRWPTN